jgi:hypothetical protein
VVCCFETVLYSIGMYNLSMNVIGKNVIKIFISQTTEIFEAYLNGMSIG